MLAVVGFVGIVVLAVCLLLIFKVREQRTVVIKEKRMDVNGELFYVEREIPLREYRLYYDSNKK